MFTLWKSTKIFFKVICFNCTKEGRLMNWRVFMPLSKLNVLQTCHCNSLLCKASYKNGARKCLAHRPTHKNPLLEDRGIFQVTSPIFQHWALQDRAFRTLTLFQTSSGFYVSAVQIVWKLCRKGKIAQKEQFLLFPQHFLPVWRTVVCKLFQFGKSLKFVVWERVKFTLYHTILASNDLEKRSFWKRSNNIL